MAFETVTCGIGNEEAREEIKKTEKQCLSVSPNLKLKYLKFYDTNIQHLERDVKCFGSYFTQVSDLSFIQLKRIP